MNTKKANAGLKNTVIYVICIVLAAFYVWVLWKGQNPQVCTEYEMYYITNELSDWPGYDKLSYNFGTVEYAAKYHESSSIAYRTCKRKGQGWQKNISGSCKNKDDEAFIYYVPNEDRESGQFNITINHYDGIGTVSIYANDVVIGTITGTGNYQFKINNIVKDELLTIKFVANECEFGWWKISID